MPEPHLFLQTVTVRLSYPVLASGIIGEAASNQLSPSRTTLLYNLSLMLTLLALIPIVLILVLMVGFKWGAARAGAAGYITAVVIAWAFFGAGVRLLAYAHTRALLLSLDVLMIIWAAFLFYRVADEAGAIRAIGQALPRLTPDRGMQVLIIGYAFASFLQGVGGFGVPVAVTAPLLVGLAVDPLLAVVLPSIGCSWSVTFGSLGSSFQALISASGVPGEQIAAPTAVLLGITALAAGPTLGFVRGGWKEARRLLFPALLIGGVMAVVQYLAASSGLWNLASFAAGGAGLLVSLPLARLWHRHAALPDPAVQPAHQAAPAVEHPAPYARRTLLVAVAGYGILIAVTLIVQLVTPVHEFLSQVVIQVPFPQVQTSLGYVTPAGFGRRIALFSHAGASLLYASVLAYLLFGKAGLFQPGSLRRILERTTGQLIVTTLGIAVMISMAVVMEQSGMTDQLARLLAEGVGLAFPLVSPWIGGLGAFMTGSNTNSNVVFASLQMRTANLLALEAPWILAAQTAGAALGSVIAPAKIIVGGSTAGLGGREGEILRRLLGYIVAFILLVSLVTGLVVILGG